MSTPSPTPSRDYEDELKRLRERVSELEDDAAQRRVRDRSEGSGDDGSRRSDSGSRREWRYRRDRGGRRTSTGDMVDDVSDTARDTVDRAADAVTRATDESRRVLRGLVLASLEPLRTSATVIGSFVDDVYDRNQPEDDDTVQDVAMRLPNDILGSVSRALNRSWDAVPNTVDQFYDSYRELDDRGSRRTRDRGRSESRGARSSQETATRYSSGDGPRVVVTTPRGGSNVLPPGAVTVVFDCDVQPVDANLDTTIVVRRAGSDVKGSVAYSGPNALVWTPETTLGVGLYSVRVANLECVPNGYSSAMEQPYVFSFTVIETTTGAPGAPGAPARPASRGGAGG